VIIAVIIVALVVFGIYQLAVSADRMLRQPVAPVPAAMQPKQAIQFQKPPPRPPVQTGTEVQGQAARIAPPAPAEQQAPPAAKTLVQPKPAAEAAPAEQPATERHAGQILGQDNAHPRVILHILKPTRILVQGSDGKTYINRILHPGDSYRVPDRVGLSLTTSDGSAVQVELDGQMMGVAGKASEIVEAMSLDPQAVVDRQR
jgi:cytoskeleton protein RodZ